MPPTQPYQYSPLSVETQQVRLFKLTSNHPTDGALQGTMQTFQLDSVPQFIALSYMWGDATVLHRVDIDDMYLDVRANLFSFLEFWHSLTAEDIKQRFLQRTASQDGKPAQTTLSFNTVYDTYLWIDQLCINQRTDEMGMREKSNQVQLMCEIYPAAHTVIGWLGNNDPACEQAIKDLLAAPTSLISGIDFYNNPRFQCLKVDMGYKRYKETLVGHPFGVLDEHPYSRRVWTLQELLLARNVLYFCGRVWISSGSIEATDVRTLVMPEHSNNIGQRNCNQSVSNGQRFTLLEALSLSRDNICGDPRDQVYGLLGIVTPETRAFLQTKYTRDVESVWESAVACVLMQKDNWQSESAQLTRLLEQPYFPSNADGSVRACMELREKMKLSCSNTEYDYTNERERHPFIVKEWRRQRKEKLMKKKNETWLREQSKSRWEAKVLIGGPIQRFWGRLYGKYLRPVNSADRWVYQPLWNAEELRERHWERRRQQSQGSRDSLTNFSLVHWPPTAFGDTLDKLRTTTSRIAIRRLFKHEVKIRHFRSAAAIHVASFSKISFSSHIIA